MNKLKQYNHASGLLSKVAAQLVITVTIGAIILTILYFLGVK